jgi:hypothetical protein
MFVDFPQHPSQCCRLCGEAEGCTILAPTWLANGSLAGTTEDGCSEFCVPGDQATADCLSYPPSGANPPCKYLETFSFGATTVTHNLTFERATFAVGPQDPALFAIRSEHLLLAAIARRAVALLTQRVRDLAAQVANDDIE